jgi:hypothetical protein
MVWRLRAAGWLVRYDPSVVVHHPARATWTKWVAQRVSYGRSTAALEALHGDAVAPLRADGRVVLALSLLAVRRWRFALAVLAWSTAAVAAELDAVLEPRRRNATAAALVARGTALSAPALARSTMRTYGVALLGLAVVCRPMRRPVAGLAIIAVIARWWRAGRPPRRAEFAGLAILDDLCFSAGALLGALEARRVGSLRPRLRLRTTAAPRQ